MRNALFAVTVLSFAGFVGSTAQAGEKTYRWTDAQGRVHYSDVKTSNRSEQVQIKPGSSIQTAPKEVADANGSRELECQRKKDQLAAYKMSTEITETDSLGKSRSFTAAERQQLIERATAQMQETCAQPGALVQ